MLKSDIIVEKEEVGKGGETHCSHEKIETPESSEVASEGKDSEKCEKIRKDEDEESDDDDDVDDGEAEDVETLRKLDEEYRANRLTKKNSSSIYFVVTNETDGSKSKESDPSAVSVATFTPRQEGESLETFEERVRQQLGIGAPVETTTASRSPPFFSDGSELGADVSSVDSDRVVREASASVDGSKDDRDLSLDRLDLFHKRIAIPSSSSSNDLSDRSGEDSEVGPVAGLAVKEEKAVEEREGCVSEESSGN